MDTGHGCEELDTMSLARRILHRKLDTSQTSGTTTEDMGLPDMDTSGLPTSEDLPMDTGHASSSTSEDLDTMSLARRILPRDIDTSDSSSDEELMTCPDEEEYGPEYELEFAMETGPLPPQSSRPDEWSITWPQTLAEAMGYGGDEGPMEDTLKKEKVENSLGLEEKLSKKPGIRSNNQP